MIADFIFILSLFLFYL